MATKHIVLYRDEFPEHVWEEYCEICCESSHAPALKIVFDDGDVEALYENREDTDEEDEEDD